MRNLVVFLHMSLDGIVEGPNGAMDIGFIHYNQELEAFANQGTAKADAILWGKNTYEMMYGYWPTLLDNADASEHERNHAKWIDAVDKFVCSESLESATWNNSHLLKGDLISQIKALKNQEGQDILALGSPRLAKWLLQEKLVDQLKLTLSPVIVGGGLSLLEGVSSQLKLIESETMSHGVLGLTYQVLS